MSFLSRFRGFCKNGFCHEDILFRYFLIPVLESFLFDEEEVFRSEKGGDNR